MKRMLLITIVIACSGQLAGQQIPDSLWIRGNQAVGNKQYDQATVAYEQILRQGYEHETLYFNLGNVYYRSGKLGLAIWAYEKGLQFAPNNTDLKYNRDVAKAGIKDRIEIPEGFLLLDLYRALKKSFTLRGILFASSLLLLLAAGIYSTQKLRFGITPVLSIIRNSLLFFSILLHLVYLDKSLELSDRQEGIITTAVTEARSTPSGLGKILFRVHEGLKVELTQTQDDWVEIILLDGKKGWVYSGAMRTL